MNDLHSKDAHGANALPERAAPLLPLTGADAIAPGRYLHYKGGRYEVLATARHSESLAPLVVYRALDGSGWWVRPAAMWHETVQTADGLRPRFSRLED